MLFFLFVFYKSAPWNIFPLSQNINDVVAPDLTSVFIFRSVPKLPESTFFLLLSGPSFILVLLSL